jgi:CelD/BcsL family acetyltransferase involved in cellulose biosynthesis
MKLRKKVLKLFNKELQRKFYMSLANRLFRKGWLDLVYIMVGSVPISYVYSFLFKNKYYYYNLAYNSEYAKYSPGSILLQELVKYSFDNKLFEFDFLRGDESYKSHWSTHLRENYAIDIVNNSLYSRICYNFKN